jgi:hypothetical protein
MTNNIFTVRNMLCPHEDFSSFLGGKLVVFKFCNYGFVLAKVWCDFWIVLDYFVVYDA